jgi:hypothetical protein
MIAKLREDGEMGIVPNFQFLFSQEASQPLSCIPNLSYPRANVFPVEALRKSGRVSN